MKNLLPLALLALACATSGVRVQEARQPAAVWLTPEVFSLGGFSGVNGGDGNTFRLASLDLTYGRLRFGTSLVGGGCSSRSDIAVLPVRVGLTLWRQPRRYLGKLYGMTPEVSLQATTAPWLPWADGLPPGRFVGHTKALFNMNIYGIGLEVGAGAEMRYGPDFGTEWGPGQYSWGPYRWVASPLVEMRVGFGVASIQL